MTHESVVASVPLVPFVPSTTSSSPPLLLPSSPSFASLGSFGSLQSPFLPNSSLSIPPSPTQLPSDSFLGYPKDYLYSPQRHPQPAEIPPLNLDIPPLDDCCDTDFCRDLTAHPLLVSPPTTGTTGHRPIDLGHVLLNYEDLGVDLEAELELDSLISPPATREPSKSKIADPRTVPRTVPSLSSQVLSTLVPRGQKRKAVWTSLEPRKRSRDRTSDSSDSDSEAPKSPKKVSSCSVPPVLRIRRRSRDVEPLKVVLRGSSSNTAKKESPATSLRVTLPSQKPSLPPVFTRTAKEAAKGFKVGLEGTNSPSSPVSHSLRTIRANQNHAKRAQTLPPPPKSSQPEKPSSFGWTITATNTLRCETCSKEFRLRSQLNRHIDCVHLNLTRFGCPLCSHRFKRSDHLRNHFRRLHSADPEKMPESMRSKRVKK